jgi:hypothetical protein
MLLLVKSLILFKLMNVTHDCFKQYIELCDSWYPVKALCDSHLAEHIKNKRIKIGDKLAIFSADLCNCPKDGCPPLEVT